MVAISGPSSFSRLVLCSSENEIAPANIDGAATAYMTLHVEYASLLLWHGLLAGSNHEMVLFSRPFRPQLSRLRTCNPVSLHRDEDPMRCHEPCSSSQE